MSMCSLVMLCRIGLEKGRMEEKRSMARNLKSMGLDPQQISRASGLSLEEIERL